MILSPILLSKLLGLREEELDTSGRRLSLGEVYRLRGAGLLTRSERRLSGYEPVECRGGLYRLEPGAYLVRYSEAVEVPQGFIALAYPRSTLLRMGVVLYTAVWDPGYRGRGVTLLVVHNPEGFVVERGAHIAQLLYLPVEGPSRIYSGVYQGEGLGGARGEGEGGGGSPGAGVSGGHGASHRP